MKFRFVIISLWVLLGMAFVNVGLGAQPVRSSATFIVDSTLDEEDASPGDGLCASTLSGICALRAAVMEANALAGADFITFAPAVTGTISLSSALPSIAISDTLTIIGPGSDTLRVEAASNNRVFSFGSSGSAQTFTLSGLTVSGASQAYAILVGSQASLTINSARITNNPTGGINVSFGGSLTLNDSLVDLNNGSVGGGIYNLGGMLVVNNSTISDNGTGFRGGGIYNTGFATIINSTINDNDTGGGAGGGDGGGVYNSGTLTLTNSTVSGNTAEFNVNSEGGGIYNFGTLFVSSSTVYSNSATLGPGGGLRVMSGTMTIRNSLIAGSPVGGDCSLGGGNIVDAGNNIVQDNTCGFTGGSDPLLGPLQDNGGPTFTHMLLPGSPAIDAGNPAGCTDSLGNLLTADQRGVARPQGPACDIGAVEQVPDCGTGGLPSSLPFKLYLPLLLQGSFILCP